MEENRMDPMVKLEESASSYSCGMGSKSACYKVSCLH